MKRSECSVAGVTRWNWPVVLCCLLAVVGSPGTTPAQTAPKGGTVDLSVANDQQDLLEAEKAFGLSARLVGGDKFELRYAIADGYYMYRDRFRFVIDGTVLVPEKKNWPAGKWKQDPTFGKVVTYRNSVHLLLPFRPSKASVDSLSRTVTVTATSQGCADAGVCYSPLKQTLVLKAGSTDWVSPQETFVTGFSRERPPAKALNDVTNRGK